MNVRSAVDLALAVLESRRRNIVMRDLFCFSVERQSDMRGRTVLISRLVNVIEVEEMNGRETRNQILELTGCYACGQFLAPVGWRSLPKGSSTGRIDLQNVSGTRAKASGALQRDHTAIRLRDHGRKGRNDQHQTGTFHIRLHRRTAAKDVQPDQMITRRRALDPIGGRNRRR